MVAGPGFPEDALKALRDGVSKKVVLNHGALDLPSPGDWFLFWSDRTMSKSAHLPAAFLAHMTDREQLKTIVRPEFAVMLEGGPDFILLLAFLGPALGAITLSALRGTHREFMCRARHAASPGRAAARAVALPDG